MVWCSGEPRNYITTTNSIANTTTTNTIAAANTTNSITNATNTYTNTITHTLAYTITHTLAYAITYTLADTITHTLAYTFTNSISNTLITNQNEDDEDDDTIELLGFELGVWFLLAALLVFCIFSLCLCILAFIVFIIIFKTEISRDDNFDTDSQDSGQKFFQVFHKKPAEIELQDKSPDNED